MSLCLAVCAGAVFGLRDAATLVSPPDAVAANFMRAVALRRFEPARAQLDPAAAAAVSVEALRAWQRSIESRLGPAVEVKGESGWRNDQEAEAVALLKSRAGEERVRLRLRRRHGEWRIAQIPVG
jgi:hypothetical protein